MSPTLGGIEIGRNRLLGPLFDEKMKNPSYKNDSKRAKIAPPKSKSPLLLPIKIIDFH